jgi:hypothetical protein
MVARFGVAEGVGLRLLIGGLVVRAGLDGGVFLG